ncbi:Oidioi.mRNA.OKI2018_I69.chr1.g1066.t1.cds [Oikopleura dioica]|uniref:Oidioi.mRNA.OKI2018_I69.chr1.g1066.t1.cds n=1 Tax=Oikopleura dioica TaxID=34765 RepID=A0ABN7SW04_OIKDI|nr:Oidioi.mRNA.OKI2018_I69.chr1.g1066.t1.cds [Oikopleura dioica]
MSLLPQFNTDKPGGHKMLNVVDKLRALKAKLKEGKGKNNFNFSDEFKNRLLEFNHQNQQAQTGKSAQAFLLNPI